MVREKDETFYVGIDGGGTKCRVQIETSDGVILGSGLGGTANPSHGLETVINSIMTAINLAMEQANLAPQNIKNLVVGAGLAGLHLPKYSKLMKSWHHPFQALYLTDDLHAALLGAHAGKDGAVAIIGTGFSALSVVNNIKTPIGGYGFLQGDHCSGSWMGYQAVQAALLSHDELESPTLLSKLLFDKFNVSGVELANKLVGAGACEYGALAPLVFVAAAKNDLTANKIIAQSCDFVCRVITLLIKTKPPRVSLIGGVAEQLLQFLDNDVTAQLSLPINTPEQGAIAFAREQHQSIDSTISSPMQG